MAKSYIIASIKDGIISEIGVKLMLDDIPLDIKTASSVNGLYKILNEDESSPIIIGAALINDANFDKGKLDGHPVFCYLKNVSDAELVADSDIVCIGIAKDADQLLNILQQDKLPRIDPRVLAPQKATQKPKFKSYDEQEDEEPATPVKSPTNNNESTNSEAPAPDSAPMNNMGMNFTPEQMQMFMQMMQQMQGGNMPTPQNPVITEEPKKIPLLIHEGDDEVTRQLEADGLYLGKKKKEKATTITVYAAKGGVGKTTISTELATFLSLTSSGKKNNRYSVCVVDYNIDFGDVCSHLGLNPKGNNMVSWAAEIDAMISDGEDPDEISYNESDIKKGYLQRMDKTGLYALIAPIAHEDSMAISDTALRVMLRNLIENCGFDYVVVDTGNNTRDGAVISLECSDHILLIATQDLTTANCNSAVLEVLQKMEKKHPNLSTDKINLIINGIIPASEAGISVKNIEEAFPFTCIARIKRTSDILKANNFSKPLVYNPKHPFTMQIQHIVEYITTGEVSEENEEPEKKKGFFSKFGKKKS